MSIRATEDLYPTTLEFATEDLYPTTLESAGREFPTAGCVGVLKVRIAKYATHYEPRFRWVQIAL